MIHRKEAGEDERLRYVTGVSVDPVEGGGRGRRGGEKREEKGEREAD